MNITKEDFVQECIVLCAAFQDERKNSQRKISNDTDGAPLCALLLVDWELLRRRESKSDDDDLYSVHMYHPSVAVCSDLSKGPIQAGMDSAEDIEENVLADPDAAVSSRENDKQQALNWKFSVVYSDTWKVPVLYFHVSHMDGSSCSRTEVLALLNATDVKDTWEFLSYDEHPVFGEPWFFLHPCQTSARMGLVNQTTTDSDAMRPSMVLSWMSMMLPSVGCRVPAELYLRMRKKIQYMQRK